MQESEKLVIGISDCGMKFPNYENWMRAHGGGVDVIKLGYRNNNPGMAAHCDAFILSGGHDVHPRFYGKPEYYELLDPADIDEQRDEFEMKIIEVAVKNSKPLLGICRGLQIANVYFGGTLVPDIFSRLNVDGHDKDEDSDDSLHHINVEHNSRLFHIVHERSGEVNSAHHQAAEKIGDGLKANAFSKERIVEGLESVTGEDEAGVLLVQWHPERLRNQQSRFAANIREWLINEAWKWK